MMPFKDRVSQDIELPLTRLTLITLPMGLMRVKATFGNFAGATSRTADTVGPAQLAHDFIAFGLINEHLNIHEHDRHQNKRLAAILPQFLPPPRNTE